jgi:hypothetical protein
LSCLLFRCKSIFEVFEDDIFGDGVNQINRTTFRCDKCIEVDAAVDAAAAAAAAAIEEKKCRTCFSKLNDGDDDDDDDDDVCARMKL